MIENEVYTKRVILLIALFSILRFIIASSVELGNDESYYWLYSKVLKWNYFDHPPMVALWIRVFTVNLLLEKYVVFLRLGSIVACALATWFMYKCVSTISTKRAGWFAACLYNASFYAGITSGLFIFPDSPQMVFYTFSLWMIAKITLQDDKWLPWILFGISTGLCIMSKVHGVFIWAGFGLYILFFKRIWLTNIRLYVALAIALAITSPILIWNIQHNFLTYRFNSKRIITRGFLLNWYSFFTTIFQHFMINNPFNVVCIFLGLLTWRRYKLYLTPALSVYNLIGIIPGLLLLFISLYRSTLPHWSGPAYIALLPLAAIWLARISKEVIYPKLLVFGLGANILFLIVCTLVINFYPGNFGSKAPHELGKADITLDMYGWKEAGEKFALIYKNEIKKGIVQPGSPVVCNTWWGAHEEYYFCRPSGIQMIGLGSMNALHEYMWMNKKRKDNVNFSTAYCIVHSDENYNVYTQYKNFYSRIDTATVIEVSRNKKPAHNFYIFRLSGWKNQLPVAR
ncbi:MAG: glycosyltransferase family 39 protein [Ginsengibacter sp.]